jgi:hypothetical protein
MSDARAKLSSPPVRGAQALRNRRIVVLALVLALGLTVIIAWIDGGGTGGAADCRGYRNTRSGR